MNMTIRSCTRIQNKLSKNMYRDILLKRISRQKLLNNKCLNASLEEIRKNSSLNFLIDEDREFMYCYVEKVGGSNMRRFLLETSGRVDPEIVQKKTQFLLDIGYRNPSHFVYDTKFMESAGLKEVHNYNHNTYFKFLIARNPWTRLLSAYRDKFERTDRHVKQLFHKQFGRAIIKRYRENPSKEELATGTGVTFNEFLQIIVDEGQTTNVNRHWRSIYDHCQPCLIKYDFIAKIETLNSDTQFILDYISKGDKQDKHVFHPQNMGPWTSKRKDGTNALLRQYYSNISEHILNKIRLVYSLDFDFFGYDKLDVM